MVGGGLAVALGVLLGSFSPGVADEEGPILLLLVLLPMAAAALIEWRYDRSVQVEATPPVRPPAEPAKDE
jgi:hypothetical protein